MNVLSLFDGFSGGQIALERADIHVDNYFASEIDKYAIQVTQCHYPKTIQLGNILNWKEWNLPKIDLLIGGSPCQGFSNAGLGLNFDDPRSKLFFTFCDILAVQYGKNPELKFLLENVKMKQIWQDVITDRMKVKPVMIDSALVSAQSRKRLYWANFPITQPEDRGIVLADIIENGEVDREKSYTIDANYYKGGNPRSYFEDRRRQLVFAHQSQKRAMVRIGTDNSLKGHDIQKRVYSSEGKSPSLLSYQTGGAIPPNVAMDDMHYRKLTPIECERLQTVEDNWTSMVSNTQRYKMLGNGWTIDVITHIFKALPKL